MKPFNLQEALAGKPVVTRDGRAARIAHFPEARKWKIAAVRLDNGDSFHTDELGRYFSQEGAFSSYLDLFMASEKKEGWVNVYTHPNSSEPEKDRHAGGMYSTENAALRMRMPEAVATVRIEWEE